MNKKFKLDFEHLLETAYIVEGHRCRDAVQGCCCRGCSECEENYKHKNYKSEKDTHCSDKCCGSDVKREDCTCSPDCEHCNCNNPLVEGHGCRDAARGCCCRGCSECEENYEHENYESEMEESENYESMKRSENWEAGTSKAPKGKSYDMSRGGAPSNVDAKKDGPGGRYRRTRPPSAPSNKTHSEMEESDGPGLREIIDSLGKPNTNVPYGDDPEADNPDYNENNELRNIADVVGAVVNIPTDKELKDKAGGTVFGIGRDPVIQKARKVRKKAVKALDNELRDIESRL